MNWKKVTSLSMAVAMCVSLAACGGEGSKTPGQNQPGGNKGSGGVISVHYTAGGFGNEAQKLISEDYKSLTGVTVKWVPSYSTGEIQSLLNSQQENCDIVQPLLNIWPAQDSHYLEDLSDVYNSVCEGESVAIKDKMNQNLYNFFQQEDGKIYQMPGMSSVSALCYNADTLDEAFGQGNWELPRTTDELMAMCKELKGKGYYGISASSSINYNWDYLGTVWWAQYDGLEAYNRFYNGEYYDEASGTWVQGQEVNDLPGRKAALEAMSELLSLKNGYLHAYAKYMSFEEAQAAFLGNGYQDDDKKVAFMVNGDWLENEMSAWLISNPQNIGMMRAPIVSDLVDKLSTVKDDATLSAIAAAVDEGAESYDGVSAEDFAAVKEARLMGYTATPNYPIAIPSYRPEDQKKLAKDFLVYLCSDRAQKIYAKELQGLCMPYGYVPDDSVPVSDFIRTRLDAFGNDMVQIFPNTSTPMVYRGGFLDFPGMTSGMDVALVDGMTAEKILSTSRDGIAFNWDTYMKALTTSE